MATKVQEGQQKTSKKTSAKTAVSKQAGGGEKRTKQGGQAKAGVREVQAMPRKKRFGDSMADEILLILIILLSAITAFSVYTNKMGAVGGWINAFFKGLFGFGAYLMPIVVVLFCLWLLASEKRRFIGIKIFAGILFLLAVSMLFGTLAETENTAWNFILLFKQGDTFNGGAIGGSLAHFFIGAFSKFGAYLFVFVALLISVMLGTGKSFFTGIVSVFDFFDDRKYYRKEKIKGKADRIRENEKKQAERKEKDFAKKKKKKGCFDIRISKEEGKHENTEELPIIEAMVFERKNSPQEPKEREPIYDFCREIAPQAEGEKQETRQAGYGMQEKGAFEPVIYSAMDQKIETDAIIQEEAGDAQASSFEDGTLLPLEDTDIVIQGHNNQRAALAEAEEQECYFEKEDEEISLPWKEIRQMGQDSNGALAKEQSAALQPDAEQQRDGTSGRMADKAQNIADQQEVQNAAEEIRKEASATPVKVEKPYVFPPITLLGENKEGSGQASKTEMLANAKKLEDTLKSFGVDAKVIQINRGPTVTRYELSPSQGVKVSKIVNLSDDIALNLAASGIRIEAPIPGKAAVGIEVPNKVAQSVYLRDVIDTDTFRNFPSKLAFALGQDIAGNAIVTDIAKMPHLLIAGATGSGKSVCINTMITSILYKANPKEVKILLVDPKVVELSVYNGVPHLLIPVVTDPKKAAGALNWAVREMLSRYQSFAERNVRDIKGYNVKMKEEGAEEFMPQIVIVIDELADLMMAAPGEVEDAICRLAQMARAAGLHLIIATQRPSVDVITGVIKANIPSRLAFAVSSGIDSRTILDMTGAEKLLGKGDMLFYPTGMSKPQRIQGAFVTDKEVESIVEFVKSGRETSYDEDMINEITSNTKNTDSGEESDEFLDQAMELVVTKQKASVSMLQRQFRIGYNRAARLMEDLETRGIVGAEDGSKPRRVLLTKEEFFEGQDNE